MINTKKVIAIILTLLLSLAIAACQNSSPTSEQTTEPTTTITNPVQDQETLVVENQSATELYMEYKNDLSKLPVKFMIGDSGYQGFNSDFETQKIETKIYEGKRADTIYLLHESGLLVTIEMALYEAYNAYEWTIYFSNETNDDSPVISNISSANVVFSGANPRLIGIKGDVNGAYASYDYDLTEDDVVLDSTSGRPSDELFPYYNLAYGNGGMVMAIGWPGTWKSSFVKEEANNIRYDSTANTGFASYLKPGETIRTGLMAFVKYEGRDEDIAINAWRKWYIDWNMPKENGETLLPITTVVTFNDYTVLPEPGRDFSPNETNVSIMTSLKNLYDHGVDFDYYWIDAGWYTGLNDSQLTSTSNWRTLGTWNIDPIKFPNGLKEVGDFVRTKGDKFLVWFEPEYNLLADGRAFEDEYGFDPSWFLSAGVVTVIQLINLGNEDAYQWIYNKVATIIEESGIDYYRDDFNNDPAPAWQYGDFLQGDNRIGITENLYVQNHLRMWRELKEQFPGLLIDSCSSGGRRNDLESMRLAVPLHRSDTDYDSTSMKLSYSMNLYKWLPYFGTPSYLPSDSTEVNKYLMRMAYSLDFKLGHAWGALEESDFDMINECLAEYNQIKYYLYDDYYPLTDWVDIYTSDAWTAWEFFNDETDSGFMQFFRRDNSTIDTITVSVKGVDPDSYYEIYDFDSLNGIARVLGSDLIAGYTVYLEDAASSALMLIKPVQ